MQSDQTTEMEYMDFFVVLCQTNVIPMWWTFGFCVVYFVWWRSIRTNMSVKCKILHFNHHKRLIFLFLWTGVHCPIGLWCKNNTMHLFTKTGLSVKRVKTKPRWNVCHCNCTTPMQDLQLTKLNLTKSTGSEITGTSSHVSLLQTYAIIWHLHECMEIEWNKLNWYFMHILCAIPA